MVSVLTNKFRIKRKIMLVRPETVSQRRKQLYLKDAGSARPERTKVLRLKERGTTVTEMEKGDGSRGQNMKDMAVKSGEDPSRGRCGV